MELHKKEVTEVQLSKTYTVNSLNFTPQVTYRDGKFHSFVSHHEIAHKVKYKMELDKMDGDVFNALKDFFKSLD